MKIAKFDQYSNLRNFSQKLLFSEGKLKENRKDS